MMGPKKRKRAWQMSYEPPPVMREARGVNDRVGTGRGSFCLAVLKGAPSFWD